MSLGTSATTAIITKGLTCGSSTACEYGSIISTRFGLFCSITLDPVVPISPPASGGGSRPFAPGEIQNFYKPVTLEQPIMNPVEQNRDYLKQASHVIIRVKFGDSTNEKEYLLSKNKAKYVVKVLSVINTTINKVKININELKVIKHNILIQIKKLKLRK
jgi:hypothetical protein